MKIPRGKNSQFPTSHFIHKESLLLPTRYQSKRVPNRMDYKLFLSLLLSSILFAYGAETGNVTGSSSSISPRARIPTSEVSTVKAPKPEVSTVATTTVDPVVALKLGHFTPECRTQLFKTDQCMAETIFLGSEDLPDIPQTLEEIDNYCSRARVTYDCVNSYKKCLRLFPKTFFGIISRDVKKTMKKLCSPAGKTEVIKHLKCFDKSRVDVLYKIMNGFYKVLDYIADEVNPDSMIPNLCCSYQYMLDEGIKLVQSECSSKTGPSTAQFMMSIVESVLASAVDLGCGRHNSIDTCTKLMPTEMELFVNLTLIGQKEEIKYTPIIPMLKIAQNLDSSLT